MAYGNIGRRDGPTPPGPVGQCPPVPGDGAGAGQESGQGGRTDRGGAPDVGPGGVPIRPQGAGPLSQLERGGAGI